ncbi:hypothetical protein EW093_15510 [Thiospirochaeta perfilievii]|uniref:histidine kinase n=1 Tax=Thiospirochaeta perfilievii TaxID=252967 RepID=A0A5C1QF54_9SPIO|nr:ATP-binding protein [Thiospirochaeta perfilievii]QEN06038.1 hypothetical protein EW093_15510 [Thiospirochaeta perfilievii]
MLVEELSHKSEFIFDTEKILDRLNMLLVSSDFLVPQIYREIHSLKGAAGFAGLTKMESLAHSLEGILSSIRNGEQSLDSEVEEIFFKSIDYFVKDINFWKSNSTELESNNLVEMIESRSKISSGLAIEVVDDSCESSSFFTDFEKTLLKEAMYRSEQFYRIICHIDRDEEMKYPRLFLVVNNLEKLTNVVKIDPPMADVSKNRSKEITLYLTTNKSKSLIYKGLSFDRIREVEVLRLEYSSYISNDIKKNKDSETNLYGKTIEVETSKIEEIFNYSQDLHNKLLSEDFLIPSKRKIVEELLSGMKSSLSSLTTISVENAFSYFTSYCNKLSRELNKIVDFKIVGGEISIDRQLAETLKELLIQLVKNSIDHGIELPKKRLENGKTEIGHITLKVSNISGNLAISLEDDGAGVDQKQVVQRGIDSNFIDNKEEISLLSLLSRPGFSTSKEINYYSGRGVGLDIVVNRVINKLDGKIKLNNRPGLGLSVDLLIPPLTSIKKYTIFKYRNHSFCFSMVNVVDKITLDPEQVSLGDNKTLNYTYNGTLYPIYTPWGRLSSNTPELDEKYGFLIRYLGKRAFFPVDEFIVEKEFFTSVIKFIDTETPTHKLLKIGEKREDYTLILPSIINS